MTAEFQGTLTLGSAGTLTFNLESDDDAFLYVDGALVDSDAGVHSMPTMPLVGSSNLSAGAHTVTLFYDDRDQVAAGINFSMSSTMPASVTPIATPEADTLSLLGLGLAGLLCTAAITRKVGRLLG